MSCVLCDSTTFAEHPELGELCRDHALVYAFTRDHGDSAAGRAALYEHAAAGRLALRDENGPAFELTPEGELWALEEVAAWPTA